MSRSILCVIFAAFMLAGGRLTAEEDCAILGKQGTDNLYRDFSARLSDYRLSHDHRIEYIKLSAAIRNISTWTSETKEIANTIPPELAALSVVVKEMLSSASSKTKQLSKRESSRLTEIERLAVHYAREALTPLADAAKKLVKFCRKAKKSKKLRIDRGQIKTKLGVLLDKLDVQIARYEIKMKDRQEKVRAVSDLMVLIRKRCKRNTNPEVKQPSAGLYWQRCPIGQSWNGTECLGKAKKMSWENAKKACPAGYRLPTREEIVELLGKCDNPVRNGKWGYCNSCDTSKSCDGLFESDKGWYWTSTPVDENITWRADFGEGYVCWGLKLDHNEVRCVATGP